VRRAASIRLQRLHRVDRSRAALAVTVAAAAIASYLPARRAASIDPMETLKTD